MVQRITGAANPAPLSGIVVNAAAVDLRIIDKAEDTAFWIPLGIQFGSTTNQQIPQFV
jgi:hypothetical protein